jgi:hypothetical protein
MLCIAAAKQSKEGGRNVYQIVIFHSSLLGAKIAHKFIEKEKTYEN